MLPIPALLLLERYGLGSCAAERVAEAQHRREFRLAAQVVACERIAPSSDRYRLLLVVVRKKHHCDGIGIVDRKELTLLLFGKITAVLNGNPSVFEPV
jgi:hypothetical protein